MRQPSWSGWASIRSNLPRVGGGSAARRRSDHGFARLGLARSRNVSRGRYCHISKRTLLVGARRRD
jgi:hypothetical protein